MRLLLTRNFLKQNNIRVSMDPIDQENNQSSPEPVCLQDPKEISEVEMNTLQIDDSIQTE